MGAADDMEVEHVDLEEEQPLVNEDDEEEDVSDLQDALEEAQALKDPAARIPLLNSIIENMDKTGATASQIKERAVYDLIRAYCGVSQYDKIVTFLVDHEEAFLSTVTKAKTARLVRQILDIVESLIDDLNIQERVARSMLEWTIAHKRSFLRQRVQAKLASILYHQEKYAEALDLIEKLLVELKKLDDKQLLVESHLLESQLYFAVSNLPKAKAALTASRTAANEIYVTPLLQASMDKQSGTLHTKEGDYNTAHSYFLEAFEQLDTLGDSSALQALKYMMLCKILDSLRLLLKGSPVSMDGMITSKQAVQYAGRGLEAMQEVAKATANRNLKELQAALVAYKEELSGDFMIAHNLDILQEQLLESNLLRIIQPYSKVEIAHVASCMELDVDFTERKLSQMILDGKLSGILDQGHAQLIVYEEMDTREAVLSQSLEIFGNMDHVVTSLFERSKKLRAIL